MKDKVILKMIKIARKYPNNKTYKGFSAFNILNLNRDWNWNYEEAKCEWVIRYIEMPKQIKFKTIKTDFKKYIDKVCFYDEFIDKAKHIIKIYKKEKDWEVEE